MPKLQRGTRLVVASHNPGKVWEINELIRPYGLNAISAKDAGVEEPEETEPTFEGNAKLKALNAARGANLPAIADDSGLEVEVLSGAPGIYSARWAGPAKDFGIAMKKVAEEVTQRHGWAAPGPRANFISVLCLAWPNGETETFEGKVFGHLVWPARGGNGFGYDPMFVPDGDTRTFGEMAPPEKYAISHRTRAFDAFKRATLDGITPLAVVAVTGRDLAALEAAASSLSTKEELVTFIRALRDDLANNESAWENPTLPRFLQAFEATLANRAPSAAEVPWRTLANALLKASGVR